MQTYQYISSGNAELGFVALSEIQSEGVIKVGSRNSSSPVRPIEQQVIASARAETGASAFLLCPARRKSGSFRRTDTAQGRNRNGNVLLNWGAIALTLRLAFTTTLIC